MSAARPYGIRIPAGRPMPISQDKFSSLEPRVWLGYNPHMANKSVESGLNFYPWGKEYKLYEHFLVNPGTWFPESTLQSLRLWKGTKPGITNLQSRISDIREHIAKPAGIVNIVGDQGYVYLHTVSTGLRIEPTGYRPNPIVNISKNHLLHELFESLRYATVSEDLNLANPALPSLQYDYLTMLAQRRLQHKGVSVLRVMWKLHIKNNPVVDNLRRKLQDNLEKLTGGDWEVYDPGADESYPPRYDMTYLTYKYEPLEFKAPNMRPNPKSYTKNATVIL